MTKDKSSMFEPLITALCFAILLIIIFCEGIYDLLNEHNSKSHSA